MKNKNNYHGPRGCILLDHNLLSDVHAPRMATIIKSS